MQFARRYFNYLVLLILLVGLVGLFFITLAVDKRVAFADPQLEAAVREALDEPDKPLHASEVSRIKKLEAPGRGISSLVGIEYLTNLTVLNLENNNVQDVAPLASLRKLRSLNLINNGLIDLNKANFAALARLPLTQLHLDYNVVIITSARRVGLEDVSVLGRFTSLKELTLSRNQIRDISALAALHNLKTLALDGNQVADLSALAQLKALKTLTLSGNPARDLSPLTRLNQLKTLALDGLPVGAAVELLVGKPDLKDLSLAGAQIRDISALRHLTHLTTLNLRDNDIADLSPLANLTRLTELNMQSNPRIASLQPLKRLKNLQKLDLQNVPVGADVSVLAGFPRLEFLDARNCAITDASAIGALMARGALQDHPTAQIAAQIDLRDNPLSLADADAYGPLRAYWPNIAAREPYALPDYAPLPPPQFSAAAGLYGQPFELTLTTAAPGAVIYYTLDGSTPTPQSLRYSAPIPVRSRAGEPSPLSMIREVSPRWTPPDGEVQKITVVRARAVRADGAASPVVTNTYLVGAEKRYSLPVISITTDPANFFDPTQGIYVMGGIYDLFYDPNSSLNPWERPANYTQRGAEWERPIHIEYFDVDGELRFSLDAGARVQGVASREQSEKSLRIYARSGALAFDLFPGLTAAATGAPVQRFETFLLRSSGNDWAQTMFRDALAQSLIEHTRLDTQAYRPAVVFLNGEYWGIHNLRERLDEYYLRSHYGVAPEDVVILSEIDTLVAGLPGDQQPYVDLLAFIESHDLRDPHNYAYVQTQMDVDNFIDYQIFEIYVDNYNWPHANVKFWRKKTPVYEPNAPYGQDGRWRWLVFDTDFSFGYNIAPKPAAHNNLANALHPTTHPWAGFLLRSLLENPEFRAKFLNRFADHLNSSFEPQRVLQQIDTMQAVIEPEIEEHIRRWRGRDSSLQAWQTSVDDMRFFAETRPQYVTAQISDYFKLSGTAEVRLQANPEMGYIRINSIDLVAGAPGVHNPADWRGVYFQGIPVEITAVPHTGYRFERWEGLGGSALSSEYLSLLLEQDISLRAVFSKE